jgi:hypothetical protein
MTIKQYKMINKRIILRGEIMKRITGEELKTLPFGSMIRIIWHNSECHKSNAEEYGVIFGRYIGYDDGTINTLQTMVECVDADCCMVYAM